MRPSDNCLWQPNIYRSKGVCYCPFDLYVQLDLMASIPPNIAIDLSSSYGPTLIAVIIASAFYGMTCIQTVTYFTTYGNDPWYFKGLVIILGVLDTIHEAFCIIGLWNTLIPKFGDLGILLAISPYFAYQGLVTSFVALFAQTFYAYRIWRFSNNWLFIPLLAPLILGLLISFIMYTVKGFLHTSIAYLGSPHMANLTFSVFVLETVVDVLIAAIMCVLLWRNRTRFYASHKMVLRLINASVSTGTCTAVFSLWASISIRVWPEALYYPLGIIPLCPLYCNAVLANLNSRKFMKGTTDLSSPNTNSTVASIQLGKLRPYGSRTEISRNGGGVVHIEEKALANTPFHLRGQMQAPMENSVSNV